MEDRKGHYEQSGDVQEWVWDDDAPDLLTTGGWAVPESEFDPTSEPAADVTSASEKLAEENASPGLRVAEQETVLQEEVDLESLSKAELVDMAADAGLDTSGTKADLIERLAE